MKIYDSYLQKYMEYAWQCLEVIGDKIYEIFRLPVAKMFKLKPSWDFPPTFFVYFEIVCYSFAN